VGIDVLAAVERNRNRIDGEIACREVGLDPVPERREVDSSARAERNPPCSVPFRERKERAAGDLRVRSRGRFGVGAGDIEVDDVAAQQLIADRAADHVRPLTGHSRTNPVIH
jgi:hypothetical protein